MMRAFTFAVASVLALPATAEPWNCTFTTACVAGSSCADTDARAQVIAADHEGRLFLDWDGRPMPVEPLPGGTSYAAFGEGIDILLTINAETAYLSAHTDAVTSFFGSCEAMGN
ncbi:hypothetical protein HKCCE4037_02565 [Rhodobacterales bacterium HKCCE4037]|nr:hypothetical protein [Rhodobacterales bacterium HKCCE4037]